MLTETSEAATERGLKNLAIFTRNSCAGVSF